MIKAVSVSLGDPSRDKKVVINLNGKEISVERIGTGGNAKEAERLYNELDGKVDAISVGGIDLYVHMDGRDYPIRSAVKMVKKVHRTPLVDGRILKYVLERRVFELARPMLGELPHFKQAIMPTAIDRIGLAQAVQSVSDRVVIGDLMFTLGIPIPIWGLKKFIKIAKLLLPIVGYFPINWILPPGSKGERSTPKYQKYWKESELIAGDMLYIRKYSPENLTGKWVITNTTTNENIEMLRLRGVTTVITTTPRYGDRSFGVNMMEAVLTAYAGKGRALTDVELNSLIDELALSPTIKKLNYG